MDWNLIPEIFYDLLARIIPGSVLILTAAMACLGPSRVVRLSMSRSAKVDTQLALLFLLLTYLVAVVIAPVWGAASELIEKHAASELIEKRRAKKRGSKENNEESRTLFRVRKDLPKEASRLIKIQAERSLCEVLIVGFIALWPVDLGFCCYGSAFHRGERVLLLAAMTFSIFSLWKWRNSLQGEYEKSLDMLQEILDEQESEEADTEARKWRLFWK